jgi:hypothetical protein
MKIRQRDEGGVEPQNGADYGGNGGHQSLVAGVASLTGVAAAVTLRRIRCLLTSFCT